MRGLFIPLFLGLATAGRAPKTCFECAQLNEGDVRMCKWDGDFVDKTTQVCCDRDSKSEYCVSAGYNECSAYLQESADRFYNFCPSISDETCGGPKRLDVAKDEATFAFAGLRANKAAGEEATCYYEVRNPDYDFKDGAKVYLQFTKIGSGATITLRASQGIHNMTDVAIPDLVGSSPALDVIYSMDQGDPFHITVFPEDGSLDTEYEFRYWTDGVEYEVYWQYYHDWFKKDPNGETLMYIAAGCAALLLILILCCCVFCCRACCCKKKNQVISGQADEEAQQEYDNMPKDQTGALSATDHHVNELELESIENSENEDIKTAHGEQSVTFQKMTKAQRQTEITKAYANPFKKQQRF